jgi:uncharacterized protein (DUF305 family)
MKEDIMKKESLIGGGIGLVVGLLIAGLVAGYSVNHGYNGMMSAMGIRSDVETNISNSMHSTISTSDTSLSTNDMMSGLSGQTGDNFDKVFLADMIVHHQGAIDMASAAKQHAKHDEIKTLADQIITAQTTEIAQMKAWQIQWGYTTTSSSSSDSMNMMH